MFVPDPNAGVTTAQQSGQLPPDGGSGSANPSNVEASAAGASQGGLSADDIRRITREELSAFAREQQSARDKMEARINKQVQAQLTALQKSGVDVTEDVKRNVEQATRAAISEDHEAASDGQPKAPAGQQEQQQQTAQNDPVVSFVNGQIGQMEQEAGLTLDEGDPEAKGLDFNAPPWKFLKQYEAALASKKQRVGSSSGQMQVPAGGGLPQMGGGATVGGNPLLNKTPTELLEMHFRKKK